MLISVVAAEIVNNGATIANDTEYALVRQRASVICWMLKHLFPKILEKEPSSKKCICKGWRVYISIWI